jgi:hypothetical protein
VNVPGFPIARARVASGQVMALVAAGASVLAQLKNDPLAELHTRIDKLEAPLIAASNNAKDRMRTITAAIKASELSNKVNKMKEESSSYMLQSIDDSDSELAVITRKQRMALAKDKKALPDGSFPIRNVSDLKNAVQAHGRAKPGNRGLVRRHIVKMARKLDRKDLVPENWKEASVNDTDSIAASLRARISIVESVVAAANLTKDEVKTDPVITPDLTKEDLEGLTDEETDTLKKEVKSKQDAEKSRAKYTPKTQPRDATGKFRQVLARLKLDLGDAGSDAALKKIEEVDNLDSAGNYAEAAKSAGDLLDIVDRLDTGALNAEAIGNVRNSAGELGKVIANLPFAFGEDAQKIRFSDVPPALQDLMEKMITRVENKIGQKDADIATKGMKDFMSGQEVYSQSEISSQMSKLLRLLT